MMSRTRCGILLALLLLTAAAVIVFAPGRGVQKHQLSFPVMGTVASLTFYTDQKTFHHAVAAVKAQFDLVRRIADVHNSKSELSRLNRKAAREFVVCSPFLWEILQEARLAHKLSGGAFDITVKPLMDHWGFYRKKLKKAPPREETEKVRRLTGLEKVLFDDDRRAVRFPAEGFAFDLGGIAKGYALEQACKAVRELGITRGVIDLGGNLRLLPEPPPGKKHYSIGIRRPSRKKGGVMPEVLQLKGDRAVSSSGDYERFVKLGGKIYGHIIDPATGIPSPGSIAVTAVASTGTRADWLSTAVYLRGKKLYTELRKKFPDTQFFIIKKEISQP